MRKYETFDINKYIGKKFGKLIILAYDHDEVTYTNTNRKKTTHYVKCKCDCGNEKVINFRNVVSGKSKSCGCTHRFKATDLIGKTFGDLIVIAHDHDAYHGKQIKHYLLCKCKCGTEKVVDSAPLKSGSIKDCGCNRKYHKFNPNDYIGKKYGKLTVIDYQGDEYCGKAVQHFMVCKCECGTECVVNLQSIKSGQTKSCGCLKKKYYNRTFNRNFLERL